MPGRWNFHTVDIKYTELHLSLKSYSRVNSNLRTPSTLRFSKPELSSSNPQKNPNSPVIKHDTYHQGLNKLRWDFNLSLLTNTTSLPLFESLLRGYKMAVSVQSARAKRVRFMNPNAFKENSTYYILSSFKNGYFIPILWLGESKGAYHIKVNEQKYFNPKCKFLRVF